MVYVIESKGLNQVFWGVICSLKGKPTFDDCLLLIELELDLGNMLAVDDNQTDQTTLGKR